MNTINWVGTKIFQGFCIVCYAGFYGTLLWKCGGG